MRSTPRVLVLLGFVPLALLASVGCAEYDLATDADTGLYGGEDTDIQTDDDSDGIQDLGPEPVYFALDGTLQLTAGELDLAGTALTFTYWPADTTSAENVVCVWTPAITDAVPATPSDETVPLYGWWSVSLDTTDLGSCPSSVVPPTSFSVGIGGLDPLLYPAMDNNALDPSGSMLYGVYTQYGAIDAPIYVYGVAGTAENYAGTAAPAEAAPLPEGSYSLQALHLLPMTPATR